MSLIKKLFLLLIIHASSLTGQDITWKISNTGMAGTTRFWISSVSCAPNGDVYAVAGETSRDIYLSTDNGNSWTMLMSKVLGLTRPGSPFCKVYICPNGKKDAVIYDYYSLHTIAFTEGETNIWKIINSGLPDSIRINQIISDSLSNLFAATNKGVYYLANGDTNWTAKNNGLNDTTEVKSMLIDINRTMLSGTSSGGIFRSTDLGTTWTKENNGLSDYSVNTLIKSRKGYIFASGSKGVFISKDAGKSWDNINNGLPGSYAWDLSINSEDKIFVADSNKIFCSTDLGENWYPISNQPNTISRDIVALSVSARDYIFCIIDSPLNWLMVSTNQSTDLVSEKSTHYIPNEYMLTQNYPNPFNPTTTISYSIPKESYVKLKVHDLLGREVSTLVNEQKSAGEYKVQFNGSGLPSGIYIYSIQAGEFRDSRSLIIIK